MSQNDAFGISGGAAGAANRADIRGFGRHHVVGIFFAQFLKSDQNITDDLMEWLSINAG